MTKAQSLYLKLLPLVNDPAVIRQTLDEPRTDRDVEATMERLWRDKALLAELFRRGETV